MERADRVKENDFTTLVNWGKDGTMSVNIKINRKNFMDLASKSLFNAHYKM